MELFLSQCRINHPTQVALHAALLLLDVAWPKDQRVYRAAAAAFAKMCTRKYLSWLYLSAYTCPPYRRVVVFRCLKTCTTKSVSQVGRRS